MNTAVINGLALNGGVSAGRCPPQMFLLRVGHRRRNATPTPPAPFVVPRGMPLFPPVLYPPLLFPFLGADTGGSLYINALFPNGLFGHRLYTKQMINRIKPTFRRCPLPARIGSRTSMQ